MVSELVVSLSLTLLEERFVNDFLLAPVLVNLLPVREIPQRAAIGIVLVKASEATVFIVVKEKTRTAARKKDM